MKSSTYYFHVKTKILANFQICISVPLTLKCGGRAVNEQSNKQNFERFKAKLRGKKYCQNMLNREYERENATSAETNQ